MYSMSTDGTRQFIVTLPSNASDEKYKQNRPSNYKTELSRPLELSDEWEVALVDIQYPLNWNNFTERTMIVLCVKTMDNLDKEILVTTENSVPYKLPDGYPNKDSTTRDHWKNAAIAITKNKFTGVAVYTQPAYYSSVQLFGEHLASMFNEKLRNTTRAKFKLSYVMDPITEIGELVTDLGAKAKNTFFLTDNEYAMRVLGYEPSQKTGGDSATNPYVYHYTFLGLAPGETMMSTVRGKLDRPFSIYVYSDIIKPQLVGDVHAPLLGVVPVFRGATITSAAAVAKAGSDSLGYWSFNPPYYLPLRFHRFDTIDVVLCTDEGVVLKFEDEDQCKVVCRLHFQKRSSTL